MNIDNNFIRTHAHIVRCIARQYGKVTNQADLMQEGYIGLIEAARRYDPTTGVQFTSYASWWVRKYMQAWMLNNSQIVRQIYGIDCEAVPMREIAKQMGLSYDRVKKLHARCVKFLHDARCTMHNVRCTMRG